jgi:hypothetical protein
MNQLALSAPGNAMPSKVSASPAPPLWESSLQETARVTSAEGGYAGQSPLQRTAGERTLRLVLYAGRGALSTAKTDPSTQPAD